MSDETLPNPHTIRCHTPDELHAWIKDRTHLHIPRTNVCPHHQAPFDYICTAYFEPSRDQIVWAPRGGGKTSLAAIATLLDLLHKPGISVRILGGSLEQSLRMWDYLMQHINDDEQLKELVKNPNATSRKLKMNRSHAAVLTQSQRSVRGLRVQKLRCDEIELFDEPIWQAAQLTTRSAELDGLATRGTIEAFSTMHQAYGLMSKLVDKAPESGVKVVRWCLLEVLQRCPQERDCNTCPLWDECQGVAKTKCDGFFSIDDAITMKQRVSEETWQSEMLCRRPSREGMVFPMLAGATHYREEAPFPIDAECHRWLAIDFGFSAPLVCLWIITRGEQIYVLDEHVKKGLTIDQHIGEIHARPWGRATHIACDPAGSSVNEQTAKSNIDVLRKHEYKVRTRGSRIVDGVELVRAALKSATGITRLFIHPRCKQLIQSLECYHYKSEQSELPHKDGKNDHAVDALRYFFVNNQSYEVKSRRY